MGESSEARSIEQAPGGGWKAVYRVLSAAGGLLLPGDYTRQVLSVAATLPYEYSNTSR